MLNSMLVDDETSGFNQIKLHINMMRTMRKPISKASTKEFFGIILIFDFMFFSIPSHRFYAVAHK